MLPKYPKADALKNWLSLASKEMKEDLAKFVGTSTNMYTQWVTGRRAISADMALRLAAASVHVKNGYYDSPQGRIDAPEPLLNGDLCEACKQCPYFTQHPDIIKRDKK